MQKTNLFQRARTGIARFIGGQSPQVRRFQAARIDRLSADWMATEASLNHELRSDLNLLRSRGRDLIQNNDYAVKFVGMCKDNIIGPGGVRLQVRIEDRPGVIDHHLVDRECDGGVRDRKRPEQCGGEWQPDCFRTFRRKLRLRDHGSGAQWARDSNRDGERFRSGGGDRRDFGEPVIGHGTGDDADFVDDGQRHSRGRLRPRTQQRCGERDSIHRGPRRWDAYLHDHGPGAGRK